MIYTSSYKSINQSDFKYNVLSISGDRGRDAKYTGESYPELAPKREFWNIWRSNRGRVNEEKNNKYYIREYYATVLSKLDIDKIYNDLDEKILLCYEDSDQFCHRQIVAAWFELVLGVNVPEVKQEGYNLVEKTNRTWVKEYLEQVIKNNTDMMGFNSLAALHLYKKSQILEENIRNNKDIELARILREYAYEKENEYLDNNKNKCKKVER